MKFSYKFKLNSKVNNEIGLLILLELNTKIPFQIKRIFYSYDIQHESNRGAHAYYKNKY